jgi:hypothetical protein
MRHGSKVFVLVDEDGNFINPSWNRQIGIWRTMRGAKVATKGDEGLKVAEVTLEVSNWNAEGTDV